MMKHEARVGCCVVACAWLVTAWGCSVAESSPPPEPIPAAPDAAPPVLPPEPFIDLGDVSANQPVTFEIRPGTLGFNVSVLGPADASVGVKTLSGPDGVAIIEKLSVVKTTSETASGNSGAASAQVPSNDVPLTPGTWTAVFSGPAGAALHASVRVQYTDDGEFHGGTLDAHVWIPDGLVVHDPSEAHAINAAAASADDAIQARLTTYFATIKEHFGLERGEVTYHALPAERLLIKTLDQLDALNRDTASVPTGPALHLMFVQRLQFANSSDPFVWALSAGIPGTAMLTGTALSAIAISSDALTNAKGDGQSLAHETGHFFGLMHTTELRGDAFDPLSDTPQCTTIDFTPQVFSQCPDAHNLMFPAFFRASGGEGLVLTESQRRVVHGSPIYRAKRR